ncbi:MAG: hypothetical protein RLZZ612_935 [Pseudomonadota bacterium]
MTDSDLTPLCEKAAHWLSRADALVIAAGAGMGVDSGLPDFRGNEGFWQAYPALGRAKMDFTAIANPAAFVDDPSLAWGFYGHRLQLYRQTQPHRGFELLKAWGERTAHGGAVFTSNVDGQFQKAGYVHEASHPIEECHGSIHHLQCLAPCTDAIWPADDFVPEVDPDSGRLCNAPPRCIYCGGLARPNILMFGDCEWLEQRTYTQHHAMQRWLMKARQPVVIELGAGTAIPSVRRFTQRVLNTPAARLIRINPREFHVGSSQAVGLPLGAMAGVLAMAAFRA